jgi:aminomuconate-semialdehyde/2-hydroxymuconate-6-semialdehyde dehydrogenase
VREIPNFIDGAFVVGGRTFDKRSPLDGRLIARVAEAGKDQIDAAVQAARAALQGDWGRMELAKRAELLYAVADGIDQRADEFLEAEVADTGKPVSLARHLDIPRGAANFRVFADTVKNVSTEAFQMHTPDGKGALNYAIRVPKGVVAVICPWNLPLLLMTWKVGPALACGNTVVVKPSEETPSTATLLGEVMNSVGVPKGVYNVVHGFGPDSAGEYLTRHPGVNAITFTGETRTGAAIMKAAADGTRAVSFELGGKNAGIVFADCDFDAAVEGIARAAFANCGQVCLGTERVYVERPVFEPFVEALKRKAQALKPGRPEDPHTGIGPLISREHREKVLSYYRTAVADGATVVTGGGVPPHGSRARGRRMGRAHGVDRAAGKLGGDPRGDLRPVLPCASLRYRGRGRAPGKRHAIRPRHDDLDAGSRPGASGFRSRRGRHRLGQLMVPARFAYALRWLEGVGDRTRRRRALARVLHRAAKHLHQALRTEIVKNA